MSLILYGSETGTAEDVAYKLHRSLFSSDSRIFSLDSYNVINLPGERSPVIFIISTTGDGEAPTSMLKFWQFLLRKSLPLNSLESVSIAVFGLGDSSYEKYNAAARKLSKRLQQLGAKELIPIGLGDDQAPHGFLTALNPWTETLRKALVSEGNRHSQPISTGPLSEAEYVVRISSSLAGAATVPSVPARRARLLFNPPSQNKQSTGTPALLATVASNVRMTASNWGQDVRHITLDLSATLVEAECCEWPLAAAGDVATIHPLNSPEIVNRAINLAISSSSNLTRGLSAESVLCIVRPSSELNAGRKNRLGSVECSLRELFSRYLDIAGVPRRSFFEGLARFAVEAEEREKLIELASAGGTDLYFEYCIREKRSYVEVLEEFRSARPALEYLLELIPPLQSRHYSIASSGAAHPTIIQLCAAVVETTTPYGRKRRGVCSSYLASLQEGDEVALFIRRGAFSCPPASIPVICVGPGTGVAPMRAILQERSCLQQEQKLAPSVLFFGCRKKDADYLFAADWSILGSDGRDGTLLTADDADARCNGAGTIAVTTAFSQDGPITAPKTYVQNKIALHGALIWTMMQAGAVVLVSGSAKRMPRGVRQALCNVVAKHGGFDQESSERYILRMEATKKYFVEAWT